MQAKGNKNGISSFYQNRIDSFLQNLSKAESLDEKAIHKLRVDIKNIRSLLLLLEGLQLFDDNSEKILKQLQKIFKPTGRLRTIQVCHAIVDEHARKDAMEIKNALELKREPISEKIKIVLAKFNTEKFKKRVDELYLILNQLEFSALKTSAANIIESELDVIYKLWASSRGVDHFHDIRKFFKVIKALLQLLLSLEDNKEMSEELKIVTNIEQTLGKWHDRAVFANKLVKIQAQLSSELAPQYRSLRNLNKTEMTSLASDFNKQMRTHYLKR
jgi:CHAD domain-containing protein